MKPIQLLADIKAALSRQDVRRTIGMMVMFFGLSVCLQAGTADTVATELQTQVNPYVNLGIKIFGGLIAIGGFVVSFQGFTGREEGFDKVFKIGTGLIAIALGVLCITKTSVITTWLSLAQAFNTTS